MGGHFVRHLIQRGHFPTVIARGVAKNTDKLRKLSNINFRPMYLTEEKKLYEAFKSCVAVAHLAGINRETEDASFEDLHVDATEKIIYAARKAGVKKILLVSFINARPWKASRYHTTKWKAEELVKASGLDYTILRPGMIYGPGDHMLSHIDRALDLSPFFAPVGILPRKVSPVAVEDMCALMGESLLENRLTGKSYTVVGPETMSLQNMVSRVAKARRKLGRGPGFAISIPFPVLVHLALAGLMEATSKNPLVTKSQIRMLQENMDRPVPACQSYCQELPEENRPKIVLSEEMILNGLDRQA